MKTDTDVNINHECHDDVDENVLEGCNNVEFEPSKNNNVELDIDNDELVSFYQHFKKKKR